MDNYKPLNLKSLNYTKILQALILAIPLVIYVYYVYKHFSLLPEPSDPTQYIGPVVWKIFVPGAFPWMDRLMVAVNLRLFLMLFSHAHIGAMVYIGLINFLLILFSVIWCYRKSGFWAGLFVNILLVGSFLLLAYSTHFYPDSTMALFCLLAFIFFFSNKKNKWFKPIILTGIFAAFAAFSKITGLAVSLFIGIFILWKKDWIKLKKFIIGWIIGMILVALFVICLFGWSSLIATINDFFNSNFQLNTEFRANVELSQFKQLSTEFYLPVYISLLILIGAYKKSRSRNPYLMAITFILFFAFIVSASRHVRILPHYIYPAFIFAAIGMAIYLSDLLKNNENLKSLVLKKLSDKNIIKIIYAIACLLFLFYGIKIGINYHFAFRHPSGSGSPILLRLFYPFASLAVVGFMIFIEHKKSKIAVLIFMLFISFWSSAYNSAEAYARSASNQHLTNFFYNAASILKDVPSKKYDVYVVGWNESDINRYYSNLSERILLIYDLFFDQKYDRSSRETYKKERKIYFIHEEKNLINAKGDQILTDDPETVIKYFPQAKPIRTISSETGNALVVLDISKINQEKILEINK